MDLWIRRFKCGVVMCVLIALLSNTGAAAERWLKLSDNKRFLVRADGTPFFYLGDTAWELFHRLDREQSYCQKLGFEIVS